MKSVVICSLCALATVALGWGWPLLTQTVRPAPAQTIAAAMGTMGSIAVMKPSSHQASSSTNSGSRSSASILAVPSAERHSASSEIAATLPVAGLIGLLAWGGAVGLQLARRRV